MRLAVNGLSVKSHAQFGVDLEDLSFELRSGELLGIGGVAGSGQSELLEALSGEMQSAPDTIVFDGQPIGHLGVHRRRVLGIATARMNDFTTPPLLISRWRKMFCLRGELASRLNGGDF